jgi:hypothetical protein
MKFSLRDLLLVTVIVALAVGWAVDHSRQADQSQAWEYRAAALKGHAEERGYKVEFPKYGVVVSDGDHNVTFRRPDPYYLPNPSAPAPNLPKD